jgi:hypothetical protein
MNKKIYGHRLRLFILLFVLQTLNTAFLFAQDSTSIEGYTTSLNLKVIKNNDGTRTFTSKLTGEGENGTFPVYMADVCYYNEAGGQKKLIGNQKTNKDGIAVFTAVKETAYRKDKDGSITIKAVFIGSEVVKGSEATLKFKDLNLSFDLEEKDSVRTILIKAASLGAGDEQTPLNEATINIYVQGLFTKLKIGDCFIENGQGSFKFPDNIPGDQNGNTMIFVKVEEDENFGDVEKSEMAKWGQHRTGFVEPTRSLWSTGAPLWMIVTLTILLVGVWSHYLYAIVQLVKIKKEGMIFDKNIKID